jgi:hypothetical protein
MTENPWTTPEAVAYFESEWQHALKQAEEALAKAGECSEIWDGLYSWLMAEPEKVAGYVGAANLQTVRRSRDRDAAPCRGKLAQQEEGLRGVGPRNGRRGPA